MDDLGQDDRGFCPGAFQFRSPDRRPHTPARRGHHQCTRWDRAGGCRVTDLVDAPTRLKLSMQTLYGKWLCNTACACVVSRRTFAATLVGANYKSAAPRG